MRSYILRRKRWWQLLKQLDGSVSLSNDHLGDMLLDGANILDWQKQLILTATGNSTEFNKVADALMIQLERVHGKDHSAATSSSHHPRTAPPPGPGR